MLYQENGFSMSYKDLVDLKSWSVIWWNRYIVYIFKMAKLIKLHLIKINVNHFNQINAQPTAQKGNFMCFIVLRSNEMWGGQKNHSNYLM